MKERIKLIAMNTDKNCWYGYVDGVLKYLLSQNCCFDCDLNTHIWYKK